LFIRGGKAEPRATSGPGRGGGKSETDSPLSEETELKSESRKRADPSVLQIVRGKAETEEPVGQDGGR